ncbi:MAG TPA: M20 family metallopeptidase [Isosphaeraceae bacterium]|nr:M20 family metallopeptidase [Isosphaeraceae bacterium]
MDATLARDIHDFLDAHRHDMVALLEGLVRAESPSVEPAAQGPILALLTDALQGADYAVRHLPGKGRSGGHLYARPRGRTRHRPVQLLVGHCDTVWPRGTLASMPYEVGDNRIKGPGAFDMKGGLTQLIFALKALFSLAITPFVTPVVFVNSDEEIGSRESKYYLQRLVRHATRAFVLEPALGLSGKLKTARKGEGDFVVRIVGKSAHAGLDPGAGASAILELAHVIQQLHALNDPGRGITVNVGQVDGGIRPNVVAPTSTALVDVRVRTAEDARRIEAAIRGLEPATPGTRIEVEGSVDLPPLEPTPRNRALWEAARQEAAADGLDLEEGLAGGTSDGNVTSLYTATLDGLGAVGDGAHAPHEFLYLDAMVQRCALLASLLLLPPLPTTTPEPEREPHPVDAERAGGDPRS